MQPHQRTFSLWYWVAAFAVLLVVQSLLSAPHTETLPYSDFKALVRAGKVVDVTVGQQVITGHLTPTGLDKLLPSQTVQDIQRTGKGLHPFVTVRVTDPTLVQDLETAKVRFSGQPTSSWFTTLLSWLLPAVLFFALWGVFMKRMGTASGVLEIGKSKAKVYMERQTGVTFDDVAGIDEARAELMEIVEFLKAPQRYRRLGGRIPKGVLIVGAPGTGKTLLAKAVAGEAAVPFFSMSGSEFVEMFVGVGAARVRDLFAQAQKKAPCIIFIDELDALGKARGMSVIAGHDEREQTLNQLLVEMDGFDSNAGMIIMAATNRPEILDSALLRPGRFDRHVALDRPDLKGREQILRVHAKQVTLAPGLDLATIAAMTPGFVGADLANLINEAALLAARKGKTAVEAADFDEAIERIVAGLERKTRVMNSKEKETIAYHEAGHALLAESRPHADRVSKISIIPRGVAALGYTQQLPTEDRYLLRKTELLDRLDVLLGGRVAEELAFGDISTGAQDDLQRATDLARHMVTQYGMSDKLGLATFDGPRTPTFLNIPVSQGPREYSEQTAQTIDDEVTMLLAEAHARVEKTLSTNRPALDRLAKLLLQREVVDRAALAQVLRTPTQERDKTENRPAAFQALTSQGAT
jgi:cell division protease FtsH